MVIACKTKTLDASQNQLNNSDWMMQILLHKSFMLEELNICYNTKTSKTVCELFSCIKKNNTLKLKSLGISEKLFDETITDETDACLMLQKLYLCTHNVTLPSKAVLKLFSGISSCKHSRLTSLCIRGRNFTDDKAAYEITICFQQNDVILRAELYSFSISDEASLVIIQSLQHNNTLQHLDMRLKCSCTLENKIDRIISAINTKRRSSDKYIPKIHYTFDYFGSLIIQI